MTDYVITDGVSAQYPLFHHGAHFTGSRATFCLDSDLVAPSANVLAIPDLPLSVLSAVPFSVTESFFGMHVRDRVNDTLDGVTCGAARSHDIESGDTRWDEIYVTEGNANWTLSDEWVNNHYALGRDLVYVLFGTPTWASARPTEESVYTSGGTNLGLAAEPLDMADWSAFCTEVATRYLGKVKYYEIWNEPNDTGFFSGTKAKLSEMVRLANQAVKAVDPTAKIISPAITGWGPNAGSAPETFFTDMMAADDGAGNFGTMADWVDIIGVHLYLFENRTYELAGVIDRINAAKTTAGVSALPTWDTESGPGDPYIVGMTNIEAIFQVNRRMVICAAKGIERTFFYQYDNGFMGYKDRARFAQLREQIVNELINGNIQGASVFTDGRVAYLSDEGLKII